MVRLISSRTGLSALIALFSTGFLASGSRTPTTLRPATGTSENINIGGTTTLAINEASDMLLAGAETDVSDRVFTVSGFNIRDGSIIPMVDDGDPVVFNFTGNTNFNNPNFAGGSNPSGGPTLQTNASSYPYSGAQGIFLNPHGSVSGGDAHNTQNVSGTPATITSVATPEPGTLLLLGSGLAALASFRRRFAKS